MSDIEKFVVIEEPLTCALSEKMDGGTTIFHLDSNMTDLYNNVDNKQYDNKKAKGSIARCQITESF